MTAASAAAIAAMAASGGIASASPHVTPTGPRPAPASQPAVINLHRAYEKALPHVRMSQVAAIRPAGLRPKGTAVGGVPKGRRAGCRSHRRCAPEVGAA